MIGNEFARACALRATSRRAMGASPALNGFEITAACVPSTSCTAFDSESALLALPARAELCDWRGEFWRREQRGLVARQTPFGPCRSQPDRTSGSQLVVATGSAVCVPATKRMDACGCIPHSS